jgi:hypothetical protein
MSAVSTSTSICNPAIPCTPLILITLIHKISLFATSRNEMCQFLCKLRCWTRKSQWKCFISYGFRVIVISQRLRISLVQSRLLRLPNECRIWRITH